jgi:uncharacterized protein (TIGR01777 family)
MSQIAPKVLVSGASGMLGTALQRALEGRPLRVLQLVRPKPTRRPRWFELSQPLGAGPRAVDGGTANLGRGVVVAIPGQFLWNPAASPPIVHPGVLEGFVAAIHLSGANLAAHRWTPAYKRELTLSRVASTRALAITLAGLRQPPKTLLIASAVGFYGDRGDELLDEASGPGAGFMADLCREWEAAARPASEAGIRVVNLRFGVVLGMEGGALARMIPIFRLGLGGRLGSGRQWMSWISLKDAVAAILFALETPMIAGSVNLTAPQPVTNAEFTHALARALHRPAMLPAPAFALRLLLGEMAQEALLASARVLPSRLTGGGFQFAHNTVDAAMAAALESAR